MKVKRHTDRRHFSTLMVFVMTFLLFSTSVIDCNDKGEISNRRVVKSVPKLNRFYSKKVLNGKNPPFVFSIPGSSYNDLYRTMYHIQFIANGFTSSVFKGIDRSTGLPRVAKVISKTNQHWMTPYDRKQIKEEIITLQMLPKQENICHYYETIENQLYIAQILEPCGDESLRDRVNRTNSTFTEEEARPIVLQILEGLKALHAAGIYHTDLRQNNILISASDKVKIIDFGDAVHSNKKLFDRGHPLDGSFSPEFLLKTGFVPEKSDIWSVGSDLYFMISGSQPFEPFGAELDDEGIKKMKLFNWIRLENVSEELNDFFDKVFVPQDSRPSAAELIKHPWLYLNSR